MIREARIVGERVEAVGEKYCLQRVLAAANAFSRRFITDIRDAYPDTSALLCFGVRQIPWDEGGEARLSFFYMLLAQSHDVIDADASVLVGPYRLVFRLMGDQVLHLLESRGAQPTTFLDHPWSTFESAPTVTFCSRESGLWTLGRLETERASVLMRSHAPAGTEIMESGGPPCLRFPHAAFGAGIGPIRIALRRRTSL